MTEREDIVGRELFEAFPDNPEDADATGVRNLRASLERVLRTGNSDAMAIQKYDIRMPSNDGSAFEERFWSPHNSPVLGDQGEVRYIIHRVEDVTDYVRLKEQWTNLQRNAQELQSHAAGLESTVRVRDEQVASASEQLRNANIELAALREVHNLNETLRRQQGRMDALLEAHARSERLSRLFQEASRLKALPTVPGLRFSALYEPAESEAHVGGDFYDAFRLADGRVVVSIGDVVGSGVAAAATMSALRQSMRGAAWMNPDPASIFNAADEILEGQGLTEFATAFVAVIDPLTFSMEYAHAGHPPALIRNPDGRVRMLESGDVPLGLGFDEPSRHRKVHTCTLQPGALLVLYTDGLTEAGRNTAAGETNLLAAVSEFEPSRHSEAEACAHIWNAMRISTGAAHDDVALLTVHFQHTILDFADQTEHWSFDATDAHSAYAVREGISAHLSARGVHTDQVLNAETIYSELIANAAQHALGKIEVVLDMSGNYAALHAIDEGCGFFGAPKLPDAYAENGRGLFLVGALARSFSVKPRVEGRGSHVRAVLQGRLNRILTA